MITADSPRYVEQIQRHAAFVAKQQPDGVSLASGLYELSDVSCYMANHPQPDDEVLMSRIRARDEDALHALHRKYHQAVFNMAAYVLKDRGMAEEVAQDIFLTVWQHPEKWDASRGRLTSWLLMMARYTAIDRLRHEKRRPPVTETPLDHITHMLPVAGMRDDHLRDNIGMLRTLVKQLPIDQQRVIYLAYFRGMTHQEMADHLDIPIGTVKSRLRLGLKRLKEGWHAATERPLHPIQT